MDDVFFYHYYLLMNKSTEERIKRRSRWLSFVQSSVRYEDANSSKQWVNQVLSSKNCCKSRNNNEQRRKKYNFLFYQMAKRFLLSKTFFRNGMAMLQWINFHFRFFFFFHLFRFDFDNNQLLEIWLRDANKLTFRLEKSEQKKRLKSCNSSIQVWFILWVNLKSLINLFSFVCQFDNQILSFA